MYCDRCGTQLAQGAAFCPSCGKPILGPAVPAHPGRLARHIGAVGILWLIYGGLHLLLGAAFLAVGTAILPHFLYGSPCGMFPFGWPFHRLLPGILTGVAGVLGVVALAGIAAGWGLLQRENWARGLALIVAVLALFNLPWGTALGIYTLWVLLPEQSRQEFGRLAGGA